MDQTWVGSEAVCLGLSRSDLLSRRAVPHDPFAPFRRATSADAASVRALTRAAYAKWVSLIGREPKPMTADYGRAVSQHVIDLYERNGELLGLVENPIIC
jgi:hypothetical protein